MSVGRSPRAVLGAAAAFDVAVHVVGYGDVSGMVALPWWSSLVAVGLALLPQALRGPASSRTAMREAIVWLAAAGVLALSSLPLLPHDLLVIVSDLIALVTGGEEFFAVHTPWLATARHLVVLSAAAVTWRAGVLARRRARGRCLGCGRLEPRPARWRPALLRTGGIVAALAPLPYVWLKLEWGTGSTIGLTDPDYFAGVTFSTPGFGDTVILGGLGVTVAIAMTALPRSHVVRAVLVGIGAIGSVMLVPVGVVGALLLGGILVGFAPAADDSVIEPWVFGVVYVGFLLWGVGLAMVTWQYWNATRPPCTDHARILSRSTPC